MTRRYEKTLKLEIIQLRRRYCIALPGVLACTLAMFVAAWMLLDTDIEPLFKIRWRPIQ